MFTFQVNKKGYSCLSFACVFAVPRYNGISSGAQGCWIPAWMF